MKFKKNVETVYTTELYYDMFVGGYIKPESFLEKEDADKLTESIQEINKFLDKAVELGHLRFG